MKIRILNRKTAGEITNIVSRILKELDLAGTTVILDRDGSVLDNFTEGAVLPMTQNIALLKAKQSLYTGERTGVIAQNIESGARTLELYGIDPRYFVSFAGGCPIVSNGNLLGSAGFSEQTSSTDENIIAVAIELAGFSSSSPERKNISKEAILAALKKCNDAK